MSLLNGLQGALGGGLGGALFGGLSGLMMGGPFGAIPGALAGGLFGGVGGGLAGLMTPNYNQMMGAYNPYAFSTVPMNPYGGFMMPQSMFGTGLATGALAGMAGGAMAGMMSNPWSMGMYGMGWGGMGSWGGGGFGLGASMMAMPAWASGVPVGVGGIDANVYTWW